MRWLWWLLLAVNAGSVVSRVVEMLTRGEVWPAAVVSVAVSLIAAAWCGWELRRARRGGEA